MQIEPEQGEQDPIELSKVTEQIMESEHNISMKTLNVTSRELSGLALEED